MLRNLSEEELSVLMNSIQQLEGWNIAGTVTELKWCDFALQPDVV